VPNNGLVIYCGTIVTDDGKEKKVNIDFEPFKPINTSLYLCDNKFHTEVSFFYLKFIEGRDS
jgi:peptide chain release factor subunit 1